MVVTSEPIATQVGINILKQGGNAVDAAVAVGFALSVTYPTAGNLGGGGFMLIRFPNGNVTAIDFRETAPSKSFAAMYEDDKGNIIAEKSTLGYLACGVPGSVAGLTMALEKYGTKSLSEIMKPALLLAKNGFPVSHEFHEDLIRLQKTFKKFPSSSKIFIKNDRDVYEEGDIFRQGDLYATLKMISKNGAKGFYEGKIAHLIIKDMEKNHGLISLADLKNYRAIERRAVKGRYRGYDVISIAPPSSGGIAIIMSLNILENYDLKQLGLNSSRYLHLLVETLKNVYANRAYFLGDADFVNIPLDHLLSTSYAKEISTRIKFNSTTPADSLMIANPFSFEGNHTTHYNVVDQAGMVVAVTTTINSGYGSKAIVDGAGFLLNNEMDDFSIKPDKTNSHELVAYKPNEIAAGKRMLSSMSPTIITKDGDFLMAVGAMGGQKIITATLQAIINVIDFDMPIQEAIDAPRIHHQWKPDRLYFERLRIPADVIENLSKLGHELDEMDYGSEVTAIFKNNKEKIYFGAADFRWHGAAIGY